jgi:hypothetical protein
MILHKVFIGFGKMLWTGSQKVFLHLTKLLFSNVSAGDSPNAALTSVTATSLVSTSVVSTSRPLKALCVGLNYANTRYALQGCIGDAKRNTAKLTGLGAEVTMIDDSVRLMSKACLLNNLNKILDGPKSCECPANEGRYITMSAHGTQKTSNVPNADEGFDEAWVMSSSESLRDDDLCNILLHSALKHPERRTCIISDTCHSATMCDLPYTYNLSKKKWVETEGVTVKEREKWDPLKDASGFTFHISGCEDNNYSYETSLNGSAVGQLSHAFQNSVEASQKPLMLYKKILKTINIGAGLQIPVLSCSRPLGDSECMV